MIMVDLLLRCRIANYTDTAALYVEKLIQVPELPMGLARALMVRPLTGLGGCELQGLAWDVDFCRYEALLASAQWPRDRDTMAEKPIELVRAECRLHGWTVSDEGYVLSAARGD